MTDVKDFLKSWPSKVNEIVSLTGWLVDKNEGLFLLGDHSPENYDHEFRVRIANSNIIYPILKIVPQLGGGASLLFYKAKATGVINEQGQFWVNSLFVQVDRSNGEYIAVPIDDLIVRQSVSEFGDYKFDRPRNPMRDWLADFE